MSRGLGRFAVACLVLVTSSLGCAAADGCGDACTPIDAAPGAGDWSFSFGDQSVEVDSEQGRHPLELAGSEVVVTPDDPSCFSGDSARCDYLLKRFRLRFDRLVVVTAGPEQVLSNVEIGLEAPLELGDEGDGMVVLEESPVHTCTRVNGSIQQNQAPSSEPGRLRPFASGPSQDAPDRLEASIVLPLVFAVAAAECDVLRYDLTVELTAERVQVE